MNPVDLFPSNGIGQEMKKARRRPTGTDPSVRSIDPKLSRADRDRRRRQSDCQYRRRPEPLLISPTPPIHDQSPVERQREGEVSRPRDRSRESGFCLSNQRFGGEGVGHAQYHVVCLSGIWWKGWYARKCWESLLHLQSYFDRPFQA